MTMADGLLRCPYLMSLWQTLLEPVMASSLHSPYLHQQTSAQNPHVHIELVKYAAVSLISFPINHFCGT